MLVKYVIRFLLYSLHYIATLLATLSLALRLVINTREYAIISVLFVSFLTALTCFIT